MSLDRLNEPNWIAAVKWYGHRRWRLFCKARHVRRHEVEWRFRRAMNKLPRGSIVLDCGANVGDITHLLAERGLVVHAFEPDPTCLKVLRERFADHPRVRIHPVAVGASARTETLHRRPEVQHGEIEHTISSSLFLREMHAGGDREEIQVIDLFDFVDKLESRPTLIKLDVEGAEVELIERLFEERDPTSYGQIFVETHEKFSEDLARRIDDLKKHAKQQGYRNIHLDWF